MNTHGARTSLPEDVLPLREHDVSLSEAFRVWLRIALLSFGGPAGQIALMHRILVDEKKWFSERRFLHILNYCMLLPGPEAQQMATYVGWLMHRTAGGLVAGGLFILPGALAILALSYVYVVWGTLPLVAAVFFGLKAAVLAIVIEAVIRIGRRALNSRLMILIAAAAFIALFAFDVSFPLVIAAAAMAGLISQHFGWVVVAGHASGAKDAEDVAIVLGEAVPAHGRPSWSGTLLTATIWLLLWLVPIAGLILFFGMDHVFSQIAVFFSKMAMVTFGGAYAVLSYVAQQAVEHYGWLKPGEMLDGLALAEATPGPLIMVLQFVAFLAAFRESALFNPFLAATIGALIATWVTFVPCFMWIFVGAPFMERLRASAALGAALAAVTAAVVGVIVSLSLWFALHTMFATVRKVPLGPLLLDVPVLESVDIWAVVLAALAVVAVLRFRAGAIVVLASSSVAGVLLFSTGLRS